MIYFMQGGEGESVRIKIGSSIDPLRRLRELQGAAPARLVLLGVMPGGLKREREMHKQFAHLREANEWFLPERELLVFINENAVNHDEFTDHKGLTLMEAGQWLRDHHEAIDDIPYIGKMLKWVKNGLFPNARLVKRDGEREKWIIPLCDLENVSNIALRCKTNPSYIYDWSSVEHMFGEISDVEIAAVLGCTPAAVAYQRGKRGIPKSGKYRYSNRESLTHMVKCQYVLDSQHVQKINDVVELLRTVGRKANKSLVVRMALDIGLAEIRKRFSGS